MKGTRQSDRVSVELPIEVSGTDAKGFGFLESTHTILISRHGAKIALSRAMVPQQEVTIRCQSTGREAEARVVGQVGGEPQRYFYGVEFLDPEADPWDIGFPPLSESEAAVARVLLECLRCQTRNLVYLDEIAVEVLETNDYLSRYCGRCTDMSLWKRSSAEQHREIPTPAQAATVPVVAPVRRTRNDRKHVRLDMKINMCIRAPQYGEEVVVTENVSRGGLRFKSRKHYGVGWVIEVALPYAPGAANIFAPARIVYAEELPAEGMKVYGVIYIQVHKGWPGR